MTTILAFIVAIIVIVAIHEYGHYLAMRAFGVRVLTFSIGFGPRLFAWRDKAGTDFTIASIPLGGYVKPLDRRDCEVTAEQAHEEFSGKPAWQRVITYAAGPLANLVLAVFLYWLMMLGGESGRIPYLGELVPGTAAAQAGLRAGDEIVAVGDEQTQNWPQVVTAFLEYAGVRDSVALTVRNNDGVERTVQLPLAAWADNQETHPLDALGLKPKPVPPAIGQVMEGSAAEKAGFAAGDLIVAVDGEPLDSWQEWVAIVRANPQVVLSHTVMRDGRQLELSLTPASVEQDGKQVGQAGVYPAQDSLEIREIHYGPLEAFGEAMARVGSLIEMMVKSIGRLITGEMSVKTLGGPLTIAGAAGDAAALGLVAFAGMLAFLSVSLGVINLLPVPMLDGGWIVFGLVEMVIRRPLPERFLMGAQSVGLMLVLALMALAIFNDLVRYFA